MAVLRWADPKAWSTDPKVTAFTASMQRSAVGRVGIPVLDAALKPGDIEIVDTISGRPTLPAGATARRAALPPIVVEADVAQAGAHVLVVRYPSGALRFVAPSDPVPTARRARRGRGRTRAATLPTTLRFEAPAPARVPLSDRRGLIEDIGSGVSAVLVKIGDIADWLSAATAVAAERGIWAVIGRSEGLKRVTPATLAANALVPVTGTPKAPPEGKRALLFLHGTFSATGSAFGNLANQPEFQTLVANYGDHVYGFDHLSVGLDPTENVKALLAALPDTPTTYDVVTHSRGGLVLRTLLERPNLFGGKAARFLLGKAVLVASPNEGTPLATPGASLLMANWFANVLNMSPGNTKDAGFVTRLIAWLLKFPVGSQPGLQAMDVNGDPIAQLQLPPGPANGQYSALVSNYVARDIADKLVDAGVGLLFSGAHDLVVPTEGGWRIDNATTLIAADRIACFGPGGNLGAGDPVSHVGFFSVPATAKFIADVLLVRPTNLTPLNPTTVLKTEERRAMPTAEVVTQQASAPFARLDVSNFTLRDGPPTAPVELPFNLSDTPRKVERDAKQRVRIADPSKLPHQLDLLIVHGRKSNRDAKSDDGLPPILVATYRGARVAEPMNTARWSDLIKFHRRLKGYVNETNGPLTAQELRDNGDFLFEALFPATIRRLLDVARTSGNTSDGRLVTTLTSMTPWIADFPWEFARDPDRDSYFAMDDAHLLRSVMTSNPIERLEPSRQRLRVLLATAEPSMMPLPMGETEKEKIIKTLGTGDIGSVVDVEHMSHATPERLQRTLSSKKFDVLHFIGHGYAESGERYGLIFENEAGGAREVAGEDLKRIVSGRGLRLAFLNACETGLGVQADSDSDKHRQKASAATGTAQTLFGRGVPVVIANQLKVGDTAAANFASRFYEYIADGLTIADATREARIAASYAVGRDRIDWAVPIVFARDAGGSLFERPGG